MRRLLLVPLLALPLAMAGHASAQGTPTCFGLPATQVLSTPGTAYLTNEVDVIVGSSGDDVFIEDEFASDGDDFICAGGGNDRVQGAFSLTVDLGSGNDVATGYDGLVVWGGPGADTISASLSNELHGGSGPDTISAARSEIYGDTGNDTLSGLSRSQVYGGPGRDTITADSTSSGDGEAGNDTLFAGFNSSVAGGRGNDRLENTGGAWSLDCGPGNDTVVPGDAQHVTGCERTAG